MRKFLTKISSSVQQERLLEVFSVDIWMSFTYVRNLSRLLLTHFLVQTSEQGSERVPLKGWRSRGMKLKWRGEPPVIFKKFT